MKINIGKTASIILALLMTTLVLASCDVDLSTLLPTIDKPTTSAKTTSTDPGAIYEVNAAYAADETMTKNLTGTLKELEKRSGGMIKINHRYSGSLIAYQDIPKGMTKKTAQWAYFPTTDYQDKFPLSCRILQLPFMGLKNPIEAAEILMQLFDEFPEMAEEMEQYNMMPICVSPLWGANLHLIDKDEVHLPADLADRTIAPFKPELEPMLEKHKAIISNTPPNQMSNSLKKETIDGYINCWSFTNWYNLQSLAKQHVIAGENGFYQEFLICVVSIDYYNSLPEELQQLWHDLFRVEDISSFGNKRGYEYMWEETKNSIDAQVNYAKENKHIFVQLTNTELKTWRDEMTATHKATLKEINDQRGDEVATAIYNRAREIIAAK